MSSYFGFLSQPSIGRTDETIKPSDFERVEVRAGPTSPLHCTFHLGTRGRAWRGLHAPACRAPPKCGISFGRNHMPAGVDETMLAYLTKVELARIQAVSRGWKTVVSGVFLERKMEVLNLHVFGPDEWRTLYDRDVGPRELPPSKEEILINLGWCKEREDPVGAWVCWVPANLSLFNFQTLVNSRFNADGDAARRINVGGIGNEIGDRSLDEGRWVVMKTSLEEGSLDEPGERHWERVRETGGEPLGLLELAVSVHACLLMTGKRPFEVQGRSWGNYARSAAVGRNGWSRIVGGLGPLSGLLVRNYWLGHHGDVGALSARMF